MARKQTTKTTKTIIIFSICIIRVLSQRFWEIIGSEYVFYGGLATFELTALALLRSEVGKYKRFIDFFIVMAIFDLFKYVWLQPYHITYWEDLGAILGLLFIGLETIFIKYVSSFKRH